MCETLKRLSNLKEGRKTADDHFRYMASCPVPDHGKGNGDRIPSLSILQSKDNPNSLIFKCFAGCSTRDIHRALDYTPPKTMSFGKRDILLDTYEFKMLKRNRFGTEEWTTQYEEQRFRQPDGNKKPRIRFWSDRDNKWASGSGGNRCFYGCDFLDSWQTLNLPDKDDPTFDSSVIRWTYLTESAHKAKVIQERGQPAIAACGGSSASLTTNHMEQLRQLGIVRVVLFPDRDQAGTRWTHRTRQQLVNEGIEVRIVRTPVEANGADAVDHFAMGLGFDDLEPADDLEAVTISDELGSDRYIADFLLVAFDDTVLYCNALVDKWRRWDGIRFSGNFEDVRDHASVLLQQHRRELVALGLTPQEQTRADRLLSLRNIDAGLKLLKSRVSVDFEELGDFKHPALINAQNCIIDLATGELLDHSSSYRFIQVLPLNFNPNAKCPQWDAACDFYFPDTDLRNYLFIMSGSFLHGRTFRGFLQCWGPGHNGKTGWTETLRNVVGTKSEGYGKLLPTRVLIENKNDGGDRPNGGLTSIMGKRAVFMDEPTKGRRVDDGKIKEITGGTANSERRLNQNDAVEWTPQLTLCISTNAKLRIDDKSDGMWDRVRFIPFENRIPEEKKEDQIWLRLFEEEGEGILAQMVDAAQVYIKNGEPPIPQKVVDAVEEYRREEDILGQFLEENVREAKGEQLPHSRLMDRYNDWVTENNYGRGMSTNKMSKELVDQKGWVKGRNNRFRYWEDFELIARAPEISKWPGASQAS